MTGFEFSLKPTGASLYIRRNGAFGASCDGIRDTGHWITEDSGRFTVFPVGGGDDPIVSNVTREEAEKAIAADWRAA